MPIVEKKAKDLVRIVKTDQAELKYCYLAMKKGQLEDGMSTISPVMVEDAMKLDKKLVSAPRYIDDLFERIAFDAIARESMLDQSKESRLKRNFVYSDEMRPYDNAARLMNKIFAISSGIAEKSRMGEAQFLMMPMMVARLLGIRNEYFWLYRFYKWIGSKLGLTKPLHLSSPLEDLSSRLNVIMDPRLMNGDDAMVILGRYSNSDGGLLIGIQDYDVSKVKGLGKVVVHYGVMNTGNTPYGSVSVSIPDSDKKSQEWVNKK